MFEGRRAAAGFLGATLGIASGILAWRRTRRRSGASDGCLTGEEWFREFSGSASVGMVLMDLHGRPIASNPAFGRMLGYDEEEPPGVVLEGSGSPEDAVRYTELYAELARGERDGFRQERRYARKDGGLVWGRLSVSLVRGEGGESLYAVGVVEDIDERKEAEEALHISERRFRTVIEQSPMSMHVFTPGGRSLRANKSWNELWSLPEDEPEGSDIFRDEQLEATGLLPYIRESIASSRPVRAPYLLHDPAETGRHGRARWLDASVYPVKDEDGRVREMALIIEDVTERKEAAEELEKSEERFRRMVQNASDVITVLGADGEIRYESPAIERILGYEVEDLVGENVFDYVHPEDVERARETLGQVSRNGGASEVLKYRFLHKDGSWRNLEAIGSVPEGDLVEGVVVNSRDVTERVRVEEDLKLKNRAIDAASNGILITGAPEDDLPIVYYNPALERITGYSEDEVLGHNARFLQGSDKDQVEAGRLRAALEGGKEWSGVLRNYTKDGALFWNEMYVAPVRDEADERVTNYVGIQNDVTERKALEERLAYQAFHDSLTGLPNRALFLDRLEHALKRAERNGAGVAVLFMDLDDFKYVNDSLGHEAGDRFLVTVAERMREVLRPADTVARLGGDEFTVLLEDTDEEGAERVAGRIAARLEDPISLLDQEVYASFSIGISARGAGETSARGDDLLRDADAAMYEAKRKGKNRHQLYESGMVARASERLGLESDLRRAISKGELRLHYQPKVAVSDGDVLGVEALVRWEHPERGMVSPADFIPLAEETGLIVDLGRWVLREACRQAREWRERYGGPSTMWVNLSARQFHQQDLVAEIFGVLEEAGLPAEGLGLEITESTLMEYGGATVATLEGLRSLGVRLAIDDFGTGYSSLSYLKRLPVDYLKIDRSFVCGLGKSQEDEVLVSAMVDLAQALGMKAMAEGVETADQLRYLTGMNCDLAQGYHFSKPLPGDAASHYLEDHLKVR